MIPKTPKPLPSYMYICMFCGERVLKSDKWHHNAPSVEHVLAWRSFWEQYLNSPDPVARAEAQHAMTTLSEYLIALTDYPSVIDLSRVDLREERRRRPR